MQELQIGDTKVAVAEESPFGVLGRLVWYSVRKQRIPQEDFESLCDKEGVPPEYRPRRTRPIDAFKNAVRSLAGGDYIVEPDLVYDSVTGLKTDQRAMIVATTIPDRASNSLPVVLKAVFDPKTLAVTYDGSAQHLVPRIDDEYSLNRESYRDEDVRKMVVEAIRGAYAFNLKQTGGVYFIPDDHAAGVESVARVIDQLPGCEMVSVPVIDREPERKTVIKQYEKATLERLGELMAMVKETIDKGEGIVPSVYRRFHDEAGYIAEQKAKYEDFLSVAMEKVSIEAIALGQYLGRLAGMVREDKPATSG